MESHHNNETLGKTLIPVINKLQDIFSQVSPNVRLDLPQVAVVGSQSSGKSSVLEALVGRDFLPRGSNIVTRRPLILQLIKSSAKSGQYSEWGEFLHCQGKRFFDFERIRQEILAETDRLAGGNKAISDKPIRLRIFSPNVLTMTLVDLPGIARVPVGDQPQDIESKLRTLILDFISHPSCIILAVSPANQDLASSDALDLARQVDPEGNRTIGVLTKLDIMDRGTNAAAALRNTVVPLRLGYIGVVLRSQEDIAERKTMAECRAAEFAFLTSKPEYNDLQDKLGVSNLSRSLNAILVESIRDALPTLRSRVEAAITSRMRDLRVYGDAPPGATTASRGALLLTILDSYATSFAAALDGDGEHLPITELAGGARIRYIFQEIFTNGLDELDPTAELSEEDVRTAIKNSGGIKGSLLIPEAPFELLVRRAIQRLLSPSLQCKEFVHHELKRVADSCIPPDVARFPVLHNLLAGAVEEFIDCGAGPAEHMIRNLVACELAYINTSHPQFIGGNRAIAQVLERRGSGGGLLGGRGGNSVPSSQQKNAAAAAKNNKGGNRNNNNRENAPAPMSYRVPLEPELFQPEDLLHGATTTGTSPLKQNQNRPGLAGIPSDGGQLGDGRGGWFSGWFGGRGGPNDGAVIGADGVLMQYNSGNGGGVGGGGGGPGQMMMMMGMIDEPDSILKRPPATLRVPEAATDQEGVQVEVTRVLVDSYFDIVRKNLQDAVPKALMHFLVNTVRRGLQQHLIRTLYKEDLFADIMSEREDIAMKRKECQEALHALRSALATLETVPAEMIGRVAGSGSKFNFKAAMMVTGGGHLDTVTTTDQYAAIANGKGSSRPSSRSGSPLKSGAAANEAVVGGGGKKMGSGKNQSAAQKAMNAVNFLGGGIPAMYSKN